MVDEIFDTWAANKMGIDRVGQVCVMIHSGSRGLGHQVRRQCFSIGTALTVNRWRPTR